MEFTGLIELFTSLGVPLGLLIFGAVKGVPWLRKIENQHRAEIREIITEHEKTVERKDEKINSIITDYLESTNNYRLALQENTVAMREVGKGVSSIADVVTHLQTEIIPLKQEQLRLIKRVERSTELIEQVNALLKTK